MLTETDGRLLFKFAYNFGWKGMRAVQAFERRIKNKEYFPAFSHFVSMARFIQQGDTANYLIAKDAWFNPNAPKGTILEIMLSALGSPLRKKSVKVDDKYLSPFTPRQRDYDR